MTPRSPSPPSPPLSSPSSPPPPLSSLSSPLSPPSPPSPLSPPSRSSLRALAVLAALAAAAGCTPLVARSSASVLGPDQSSAVVRLSPDEAALELADLFAVRGYAILDQRHNGDALVLRLAGARRTLRDRHYAYDLGSAYYVFIVPRAGGHAAVGIIGRPIYEGDELCTPDASLAADGCTRRTGDHSHERELDGRAEAELVKGVLTELRMRGVVDAAAVAFPRMASGAGPCGALRQEALAEARAHRDVRTRAVAHARVSRDFADCQ